MTRNHLVETVRSGLVETVEEVAVHVKDRSHRRVAKAGSDCLGVLPTLDEKSSVGMPEVVEPAWLSYR